MSRCLYASLIAVCVLAGGAAGAANPPARPSRTFEQQVTVSPLGNATLRMKWSLPKAEYDLLMRRLSVRGVKPSGESLAYYFNLNILDVAAKDIKVVSDATKHEITATFTIEGLARTTGATTWAVELPDNARWYHPSADYIAPLAASRDFEAERAAPGSVRFASTDRSEQVLSVVRGEVKLPAGATRAQLAKQDDGRWAVTYRLAKPITTGDSDAEVEATVEARHEVMPALHKLYSDPLWPTYWLGRTMFRNPTDQAVTNVRVRARVSTSAGQTAWSEWEEIASVVYPGQSAQFALTPVLDAKALMLTSKENGKLHVEIEYTAGGKKTTKARTARLTVLGRNDALYTNLPMNKLANQTYYHSTQEAAIMLAGFITPHDPVVKELKGLVSKHIGGRPTMDNDEGSVKFAKALYDFFRANIAYSSPTGTHGEDGKLLQHINYARNVFKNGTGTCIDLAVAYASVCEAAGIEAGVCLIPGHAFPYVVLPRSRRILWVDVVYCDGGTLEKSHSFHTALRAGDAHVAKDQPQTYSNMKRLRKHVSAPELPKLDEANPLKAWGRQMPAPRPEASFGAIKITHDTTYQGKKGMRLDFDIVIQGAKGESVEVRGVLLQADGKPVLTADKAPLAFRFHLKQPDKGTTRTPSWAFFSYQGMGIADDGNKQEFRLVMDIFCETYKESAAAQPIGDRLLVKREKTDKGVLSTSVLFTTRRLVNAKGVVGYEVLVKDVSLTGYKHDGSFLACSGLFDPETGKPVNNTEGKHDMLDIAYKGPVYFWYVEANLPRFGADKKALPRLGFAFWDAKTKEWITEYWMTYSL